MFEDFIKEKVMAELLDALEVITDRQIELKPNLSVKKITDSHIELTLTLLGAKYVSQIRAVGDDIVYKATVTYNGKTTSHEDKTLFTILEWISSSRPEEFKMAGTAVQMAIYSLSFVVATKDESDLVAQVYLAYATARRVPFVKTISAGKTSVYEIHTRTGTADYPRKHTLTVVTDGERSITIDHNRGQYHGDWSDDESLCFSLHEPLKDIFDYFEKNVEE